MLFRSLIACWATQQREFDELVAEMERFDLGLLDPYDLSSWVSCLALRKKSTREVAPVAEQIQQAAIQERLDAWQPISTIGDQFDGLKDRYPADLAGYASPGELKTAYDDNAKAAKKEYSQSDLGGSALGLAEYVRKVIDRRKEFAKWPVILL